MSGREIIINKYYPDLRSHDLSKLMCVFLVDVVKCPDRTTLHSTLNTRQMIPRSDVKDKPQHYSQHYNH